MTPFPEAAAAAASYDDDGGATVEPPPPVVNVSVVHDDDYVGNNKVQSSSLPAPSVEMPVIFDNMDSSVMKVDATQEYYHPCSRSFAMRLTSNVIFVLASCLYVTLAALDLDYFHSIQGISDDVLLADDVATWQAAGFVDDDYFFSINDKAWVSGYQMIYFSAALCFCLVGLLDFIQQPGWLSIGMISAGCFGLISAMLLHKNVYISNIFNLLSVHLFMVEAIGLFFHHGSQSRSHPTAHAKNTRANSSSNSATNKHMMEPLQYFVRVGDVSWIGGTLMDVVLSYCALRNTYNLAHAKASVLSSVLWLACSMIYITATCVAEYIVRKQFRLEAQFEKSYGGSSPTSTSRSHSPPRQTETRSSSEEDEDGSV
jgi:hypothetical protein